jgi:hypothetical protein
MADTDDRTVPDADEPAGAGDAPEAAADDSALDDTDLDGVAGGGNATFSPPKPPGGTG